MSTEGTEDEDMIVVLISEEDGKGADYQQKGDDMLIDEVTGEVINTKHIKQEVNDEVLDEDLSSLYLDLVKKYGTPVDMPIPIKQENKDDDDDFEYEYLDDNSQDSDYVPEEQGEGSDKEFSLSKNERSLNQISKKNVAYPHRFKLLTPDESHSFVEDLRKVYPEFVEDQEALILHLAKIMKAMKPPPPPNGYCTLLSAKQYQCVVCLKITDTKAASERHYAEKHGPRYLNCHSCGVDFRCVTNLYKHEKRCLHPDAEIVLRARAICVGFKGANRPFLGNYQTRVLTPAVPAKKQQRFLCEICNAVFRSSSNLESHLLLHTGQRPFKCDQCAVSYTNKARLKRHLQSHGDERFECDICGRSYPLKSSLAGHMETHIGRRFHCPYGCDRRYASNLALRIHVDSKHLNKPPPCACNICPKRFFKMSLLKVHMKKAHGLLLMTRNMLMKQLPRMDPDKVKSMFGDIAAYVHKGNAQKDNYTLMDNTGTITSSDALDINTMELAQFDPEDNLPDENGEYSDMPDLDNPRDSDEGSLITGDFANFSDELSEDYMKANSLGCFTLNIDDHGTVEIKKERVAPQNFEFDEAANKFTNNNFNVNINDAGVVDIKEKGSKVLKNISLEDVLKGNKKFKVVMVNK